MKVLLYGLNYAPEPVGIGKYSGELVAWLAARGHRVRVITAPPYFPSGVPAATATGANNATAWRSGVARCGCPSGPAG